MLFALDWHGLDVELLSRHPDGLGITGIGLVAQDKGADMFGWQQLHFIPQCLRRSGPVVRPATGLQRDERPLTIGKECGHPITPEFVPRDFAGLGIYDVELEHVLGDIHSDDGQHCGRLHGGASGSQVWLRLTSTLAL